MFKFIYVTAHIHFEEQMKVLCHTVGTDVAQNCHKEFSLPKILGRREESHICLIYEVTQSFWVLNLVPLLVICWTALLFHGLIASNSLWVQLKPSWVSEWVSMRHILKVLHHYPTVKFVMLLPALLTCLMKHWIWAFYYCLSLGLIITEDRMYDMNMKWSHLFAWPGCM